MAPVNVGETNLVHAPEVYAALAWFVCGLGFSYAVIMLWLGRKRYVRQSLGDLTKSLHSTPR